MIDLLITNIGQLVTCDHAEAARGAAMTEVGAVRGAAIAVDRGRIVALGPAAEVCAAFRAHETLDAEGGVVCPGFVDPHTHAIYGGDRVAEFEQRIAGASYLEIAAAGGGIASTMRATRAASSAELIAATRARLAIMAELGTTTVEIKSGYGLSLGEELRLLEAIEVVAQQVPQTIVPTFLGAHTIPPEYRDNRQGYLDLLIGEMIPAVAGWYRASWFARSHPERPLFIDVFCEQSAFSAAELDAILAAGAAHGMRAKAHVDQFTALGGLGVALRHGAISVDHLEVSAPAEIAALAASTTVGVVIPAANVNLGLAHHAPARAMIDAGVALALCTDLNPGSAPCYSMPLVMALACRYMRLLPSEALLASTLNAAYALGLGASHGSLAVGKRADLQIAALPDYRHFSYYLGGNPVRHVICGGAIIR